MESFGSARLLVLVVAVTIVALASLAVLGNFTGTKAKTCDNGKVVGDRWAAPDGCNTCVCTETGIACTELGCAPPPDNGKYPCGDDSDCVVKYSCEDNSDCVLAFDFDKCCDCDKYYPKSQVDADPNLMTSDERHAAGDNPKCSDVVCKLCANPESMYSECVGGACILKFRGAGTCESLESTIYQMIESGNYCNEDSDCTAVPLLTCPFGCWPTVNKDYDFGAVSSLIRQYWQDMGCEFCEYECGPRPDESTIICSQGRCATTGMEVTKEYTCDSAEDCVLAFDYDSCCDCGKYYPASEVDEKQNLMTEGEWEAAGHNLASGRNPDCADTVCDACRPRERYAECMNGKCATKYKNLD